MPKVSIIIPVYNQEKYIKTCLESVLSQSFSDYECIVVDDGSSDNSYALMNAYDDPRVHMIQQKNQGVSVARNTGLEIAQGKWIAFIDPDDFIQDDYLEKLISFAEEGTLQPDIVATSCTVFGDGITPVKQHFFPESFDSAKLNDKKDLFKQLFSGRYMQKRPSYTAIGVPWGKLYKRSFLGEHNLYFDIRLRRMQDNVFNCYAFYYATLIRYVDYAGYHYRLEGLQGRAKKNAKCGVFRTVLDEQWKFLQTSGLIVDEAIQSLYAAEYVQLMYMEYRTLLESDEKESREKIVELSHAFREKMRTLPTTKLTKTAKGKVMFMSHPSLRKIAKFYFSRKDNSAQ